MTGWSIASPPMNMVVGKIGLNLFADGSIKVRFRFLQNKGSWLTPKSATTSYRVEYLPLFNEHFLAGVLLILIVHNRFF